MGMENTCCGCTLQRGTKIIAILDLLVAFTTLLTFVFFDKLTQFMEKFMSNLDPAFDIQTTDNKSNIFVDFIEKKIFQNEGPDFDINPVVYLVLALVWATCDIAISFLLIHGSNNRSRKSCKWWFRFRVIFLIGFIVYFFVCMTQTSLFLYGITDVIKIFYRIYCLSTVDSFIRQLERERSRSIGIPHVQIVTPDGSYAELFPNRDNFRDFYPINPDILTARAFIGDQIHGNPYARLN